MDSQWLNESLRIIKCTLFIRHKQQQSILSRTSWLPTHTHAHTHTCTTIKNYTSENGCVLWRMGRTVWTQIEWNVITLERVNASESVTRISRVLCLPLCWPASQKSHPWTQVKFCVWCHCGVNRTQNYSVIWSLTPTHKTTNGLIPTFHSLILWCMIEGKWLILLITNTPSLWSHEKVIRTVLVTFVCTLWLFVIRDSVWSNREWHCVLEWVISRIVLCSHPWHHNKGSFV